MAGIRQFQLSVETLIQSAARPCGGFIHREISASADCGALATLSNISLGRVRSYPERRSLSSWISGEAGTTYPVHPIPQANAVERRAQAFAVICIHREH